MKVTQYHALGFSYATLVDRERGILDGLRPLAVQSNAATGDEQLLGAYRELAADAEPRRRADAAAVDAG